MFVLNNSQVIDYHNKGIIHITDISPQFLHSTYYYFRLGRHYQMWDPDSCDFIPQMLTRQGKNALHLAGKGYALITSLERFRLSDRVMAEFGQISDLAQNGLRLNHSPFVDPHFEGNLAFAIENCLERDMELRYEQPIGKIRFFDISDTYPVAPPKGTVSERKFEVRKRLDDKEEGPWKEHSSESIGDFD
jgi:deoxycytidine triphosphate deaminase